MSNEHSNEHSYECQLCESCNVRQLSKDTRRMLQIQFKEFIHEIEDWESHPMIDLEVDSEFSALDVAPFGM